MIRSRISTDKINIEKETKVGGTIFTASFEKVLRKLKWESLSVCLCGCVSCNYLENRKFYGGEIQHGLFHDRRACIVEFEVPFFTFMDQRRMATKFN